MYVLLWLKNYTLGHLSQELLTQPLEWPHERESITVLDPGFNTVDSRYWTGILDSNHYWDLGFLELFPVSQRLRFRSPDAKVSPIPYSDFEIQIFRFGSMYYVTSTKTS